MIHEQHLAHRTEITDMLHMDMRYKHTQTQTHMDAEYFQIKTMSARNSHFIQVISNFI